MDLSGDRNSGVSISPNGVESPAICTECLIAPRIQGDTVGAVAPDGDNVPAGSVVGCPTSQTLGEQRDRRTLVIADCGNSDPGGQFEGCIAEGHICGWKDRTTIVTSSQHENGAPSDEPNDGTVVKSHSLSKFDSDGRNGLIRCHFESGFGTHLDRTEFQMKQQCTVLHPRCCNEGLKDSKGMLGQCDSLREATNASLLGIDPKRALARCISAAVKGFLIGTGLRGGFALFSVLVRLKRRASRGSLASLSLITSNREAVIAALKDTLRYGMFLGTYAGTFCGVDEALAGAFGSQRTAKWRKLVAGAIAGPSLLFTGPGAWHTSMAIYILVRAAVLAARVGIQSKDVGWIFRPLTWSHGDTFLMCLSSSQILWSWIMKPSSLPSSYVAFVNKQGGKDAAIIKGIQEIALKQWPLPSLKKILDHYRLRGLNLKLNPNMEIPCTIIHGGQGCISHSVSYFLQSYLRAIPVYIPVHLVGALIVQRTELFRRAKRMLFLKKISLGIARSSLFLSVYAASAWLWTCGLFRATGICTPELVAIGTFPTGLALLLEQKSRRMEIALYCLSRAIESFSICVRESGLLQKYNLKPPKRVDVLLFSLATAIIMQCHSMEDMDGRIIRPKYRNVLNWVFGESRPEYADQSQATSSQVDSVSAPVCSLS